MILKIPFYENNGDKNKCMQINIKCVFKHFLDKDFFLNKFTGRKENLWNYTIILV
jgi:hypothetical protein